MHSSDQVINTIICDDVLKGLARIPDNSVSLVCTSPPYNVGIDYDQHEDEMPYREYVKWLSEVWKECYRVLRKGGRLVINIGPMTNRQEDRDECYIRDIRTDIANDLRPMGFKFFAEHIWYKSSKDPSHNGGQFEGKKTAWGSYRSPSMPVCRRNHEYLLVYSKQQFRLEQEDGISGNPDITADEFQLFIGSVWWMNAETKNMGGHPVPFPEELPYRCIKLYTYPNDVVLDVFNGTGTTTKVAHRIGRRYIGIDMSPEYCKFADGRLSDIVTDIPKYEKPPKATEEEPSKSVFD